MNREFSPSHFENYDGEIKGQPVTSNDHEVIEEGKVKQPMVLDELQTAYAVKYGMENVPEIPQKESNALHAPKCILPCSSIGTILNSNYIIFYLFKDFIELFFFRVHVKGSLERCNEIDPKTKFPCNKVIAGGMGIST